jgi:hypothetical protein
MDAPVDNVTEVWVQVDAIRLKSAGGPPTDLPLTSTSPITVNLLELTDEDSAALLVDRAEIPAGSYEWLELDVSADLDGTPDSYVITDTGGQEEIFVPSGRVRLVSGFEIGANQAVQFLFDWGLRHALADAVGQGYVLKPAFRVLEVDELGALSGTVAVETINGAGDPNACLTDDPDPDLGNVVYVFAGAGVTPDDIDGADPEPVATAEAKQELGGTGYVYRTPLAPGAYTVAFSCQAEDDHPETDETGTTDEIEFLPTVDIEISTPDSEVVVDF